MEWRRVDVALQVTEPGKGSETTIISTATNQDSDYSAQTRAKRDEKEFRPAGTRVSLIASGPAGSLDHLIKDD